MNCLRLLTKSVLLVIVCNGCSMLSLQGDPDTNSRWANWDSELAVPPTSRATPVVDRVSIESRADLRDLEENLRPGNERRQYDAARPYLNSVQERIEFLRLPSYEARERYLQTRLTVTASPRPPTSSVTLRLGMNRQNVESMLGQPDQIEHAGNPNYGNERWQYTVETTSERGFSRRKRVIYFESGRVVGWQTN